MISYLITDYYQQTMDLLCKRLNSEKGFNHIGPYEKGMFDSISYTCKDSKNDFVIIDVDTITDEQLFLLELRMFKMTEERINVIFISLNKVVGDIIMARLVRLSYFNIINLNSNETDEEIVDKILYILDEPVPYIDAVKWDQKDEMFESEEKKKDGVGSFIKKLFGKDNGFAKESTKYISVMGLQRNVGVTHTSILIAYYYKKIGATNVAVVSNGGNSDYKDINIEYNGSDRSIFKVKGVMYYSSVHEFFTQDKKFDVVVFDCGTSVDIKENSVLDLSNKKFLLCPSAQYHLADSYRIMTSLPYDYKTFTHLLPLASSSEIDEYCNLVFFNKVYSVPYHKEFLALDDKIIKEMKMFL